MYDDVTREAEQFLYREARLLNERRFQEWLELSTNLSGTPYTRCLGNDVWTSLKQAPPTKHQSIPISVMEQWHSNFTMITGKSSIFMTTNASTRETWPTGRN